MSIIKFINNFKITIISIIAVIGIIFLFLLKLYTSDGKFVYDNKTGEIYFVDTNNNRVTNKEVKYKNAYYYIDDYGQKVINEFINNKYYKKDGKRLENDFCNINNSDVFFDKNGEMVFDSYIIIDNKKYYANKNGVIEKNKWIFDKYYVDNDGVILTNTITPDGSYVDADGKYYFKNYYNVDVLNTKVGDIIEFGLYEQKRENGKFVKNPIEWVVLENNNGLMKLISKNVLDNKEYNYSNKNTIWENSDLRNWLHNKFYNVAFSRNDKEMLLEYENINNGNKMFGMYENDNTLDKIFILSKEECIEYFGIGDITTGINEKLLSKPTDYAMKDGLYVENGYANYWLRNNGCDYENAMNVMFLGTIDIHGVHICAKNIGVRPVIYIDFKKGLNND